MIPISDELRDAVINEVMPKTLTLTTENNSAIELFNWYSEKIDEEFEVILNLSSVGDKVDVSHCYAIDKLNYDYENRATYVYWNASVKNGIFTHNIGYFRLDFTLLNERTGTTAVYSTQNRNANITTSSGRIDVGMVLGRGSGIYKIQKVELVCTTAPLKAMLVFFRQQFDLRINTYTLLPYNNKLYATEENVEKYLSSTEINITNDKIVSESFSFEESICTADKLKLGLCESSKVEVEIFDVNANIGGTYLSANLTFDSVGEGFEFNNYKINDVQKRQVGGKILKKIIAYDKLHNLSQNVHDWFERYMFGLNVVPHNNYSFDYERTIFATYYNLAREIGITSKNDYGSPTLLERYNPADFQTRDIYFDYTGFSRDTYARVIYSKKTLSVTPLGVYVVSGKFRINSNYYATDFDAKYRGVNGLASVLVNFHRSGDLEDIRGLYDSTDLFVIPPDCTEIDVYVPYCFGTSSFGTSSRIICTEVLIQSVVFNNNELVNGYLPLPYYDFSKTTPTVSDIVTANKYITARDITRSLMEMCGCFLRIDRTDGVAKFIYAQEHGLYPSNTLSPADDLFPKKSSEMTMPTSYYINALYEEDYSADFGGVQVAIGGSDDDGSVCRWEHWESETNENAYIIDDNVFLCSDTIKNDGTHKRYIPQILENMFRCFDQLKYTPFTANVIGTPFLESGDRFTLLTKNDGFESFIFERRLKGIQVLKDYFEARGVANTPKIKTYE